jgi:hypothetical protein
MEHDDLLLYLQKPTTGLYPEPTRCLFKIHFNVVLPSTHRFPKYILSFLFSD